MKHLNKLLILIIVFAFSCNNGGDSNHDGLSKEVITKIGTVDDREDLFNDLYQTTLLTEAFSPIKEKNLGVRVEAEMLNCKSDFLNARSEEDLYFAILRMSCARKDRHLSVDLVEGGLQLDSYAPTNAPLKFKADFGDLNNPFLYLSNFPKNILELHVDNVTPAKGDKVIGVNGLEFSDYFNKIEPYLRYSAIPNLWMRLASTLTYKSPTYLPSEFLPEQFTVELERSDGSSYTIAVPYNTSDTNNWTYSDTIIYPGYKKEFETTCYHLYLPEDPDNKTILLWWYGFRGTIEEDMERLMDFATEKNLLDHDIILDMTKSRGGSRGAEMLTRLSPKPYKTTFGNIRLSEIGMEFIGERLEEPYKKKIDVLDGDGKEGDNAKWVLDWINEDVYPRYRDGKDYSSNVPFKCAHAPHHSDGILQPQDVHFTGKMVCLFSPWGGSHLDQFSSIVADNDLAHTIGMQTGGYSNTWEAEKVIRLLDSGKPLVKFMWSIGHTISPNGEIVEGNAAPIDEYIPQTRENEESYFELLLDKSHRFLDQK